MQNSISPLCRNKQTETYRDTKECDARQLLGASRLALLPPLHLYSKSSKLKQHPSAKRYLDPLAYSVKRHKTRQQPSKKRTPSSSSFLCKWPIWQTSILSWKKQITVFQSELPLPVSSPGNGLLSSHVHVDTVLFTVFSLFSLDNLPLNRTSFQESFLPLTPKLSSPPPPPCLLNSNIIREKVNTRD